MGIFFKENAFGLLKHTGTFTLENQDDRIDQITQYDILSYLSILYQDEDQFAILEAPYPINHVQCIHAVKQSENHIEVQIAIEKENESYLFSQMVNEEECTKIFLDFFKNGKIPDMSKFEPVHLK